jgi:hypothetical protein
MDGTKAYACTEDCKGTGGIIFANSNIEARKSASSIWGDGELRGWRVHRQPGLDKFNKTGVPAWLLVADGWRFECSGCGMTIEEERLEDEGLNVTHVVGKENGRVFCCHSCRIDFMSLNAAAEAHGEAFLEMMRDLLRNRFSGEDLFFGEHRQHVYVRRYNSPLVVEQAWVSFSYPEMKYGPATLKYEKNGEYNRDSINCGRWFYSVPAGDIERYEKWAARFPRKGYL